MYIEFSNKKNIENILLLLEYEFFLINILNYEIYVYCPYKAMLGFIHELVNSEKKFKQSGEKIIFDDNFCKEFEKKELVYVCRVLPSCVECL